MAQVYSDVSYNTDGYWLLAEEYLASTPSIIPALQSTITLKTALFGNAITSTALAGSIYSEMILLGNAITSTTLAGNIYSTMLLGGSNIVCNPILSRGVLSPIALYPLNGINRSYPLNGINRSYPLYGINRSYP